MVQSGSIRGTHTEKFLTEQKDVTVGSKRKPRWFDIRDELSAPTVVYVKWGKEEKRRTNEIRTAHYSSKYYDGGENDFRGTAVGKLLGGKGERDKAFIW